MAKTRRNVYFELEDTREAEQLLKGKSFSQLMRELLAKWLKDNK